MLQKTGGFGTGMGILLQDAPVYCQLCDPPRRVEIPPRVFYKLQDSDLVSCPGDHQGTLLQYKQAAACLGSVQGPFVRFHPHPADWLPPEGAGH